MNSSQKLLGDFYLTEDVKIKSTINIASNGSFILEAENAFSENDKIYEVVLFGNLDNGNYATLIKPFYRKNHGVGLVSPKSQFYQLLY